jgi:hypothetical protein
MIRYLKAFICVFFFVIQGFIAPANQPVIIQQEEKSKELARILKSSSVDYVMVASHRSDWRNAPEDYLKSRGLHN